MARQTTAEAIAAAMWPILYPMSCTSWAAAQRHAETSSPMARIVAKVRAAAEAAAQVAEGVTA